MPVCDHPVYVDPSGEYVLHVYVSAQAYVGRSSDPYQTLGEYGKVCIASTLQLDLFNLYMQRLGISAPEAVNLYYNRCEVTYPAPLQYTHNGTVYEIGMRSSAYEDIAVFYIENRSSRSVRILEVVCQPVAPFRVSAGGAASGAVAGSGRVNYGHGANLTAAPRGGSGGRGRVDYGHGANLTAAPRGGSGGRGRGRGQTTEFCVPLDTESR